MTMSGRRGQGQMPNFDASFSRRPNNAQNISSLLGEPPASQSKNTNYSKNPFSSGNNDGGNYNDNYSRRDSFPSGGGGGGQNFGGNNNNNSGGRSNNNQRMGGDDFGGRQGGGQGGGGNFGGQQNRFDQQGGGGGNESPPVPRDRNPAWNTNQNPGMDFDNNAKQQHLLAQQNLFNAEISRFRDGGNSNNNSMQNMNMGQMNQMSQEQQQQGAPPVVMVMPQGQGATNGMMGMMQANQNPFNVLAGQQRPMQVILGNLPAFNPDVFGQQILQGVGGGFGQGMIPQNMGIMSQQQQQPSQQFNRFNDNSGPGRSNFNNSSERSNNSSRGQNQNRSSSSNMGNRSSGRRSDSNANNRNSDGRGGVGGNNSTPSRDQRKRGGAVLRDPVPDDVVDRKRAKHSGNLQTNNKGNNNNRNNRGQQNRTGNNAVGGNKNKKANNKQNNKANDKVKKEEDKDKKDVKGDDKKAEDKKDVKEEKTEDMDTSTVEEDGKEKQKEKKVSKYDEFPASLLVCKICQKVMNDGSSFESHLSGRAHLALVKILEQRFQKRTELLMQESKLAEDEIGVEMERQRRAGKNNQSGKNSKNYCKMCDCNYMVNWGTHKVSLGHRILKEFLHPTCRICNAHFVHRADWIAHLITLSHLRRLVELKGEGADMTCHESATQDELFAISIDMSGDDHITNAITIKAIEPQVVVKDDMSAMLNNGKDDLAVPEGEITIPETYDEAVAVGEEAIMTVAGSCCKVCRQFIADEADVQPHLKSKTHFNIYVAHLKQLVKAREEKAEEEKRAAEEAEKKAKKEKEDEEKKAAEEAEKSAKAELETKSDGEVKPEAEATKEESAAIEKVEESEKMEVSKPDTSTPAEEKGEFVVEEEIGGDDETNGPSEEMKTETSPVKAEEKTEVKSDDKPEVKSDDKPEEKKDGKPEEIKEEIKAVDKKAAEPVATTPKAQNNQNRGRGANRGPGGGRGRGANQTPNVNKPTTRVDTPMRGGRGQNSARSPRGGNQRGGNTGGGNWRGGARGGRGRPFQR